MGVKGVSRQSTEEFGGNKTNMCDSVIVYACHYSLVQTHRMYNIKSEPNINYGLWVMMMC